MKEGYIPRDERKKILLMGDDCRFFSGIATVSKDIILGTAHHFKWCQLAGSINHPEAGKKFDLSPDTNKIMGIEDAYVMVYPINGYGDMHMVRRVIALENPDAIMLFTDPRYWMWLFAMENEIRAKIPIIYLSIWDDDQPPLYNYPFYSSCDLLMAISKQTHNIHREVLKWGNNNIEELTLN